MAEVSDVDLYPTARLVRAADVRSGDVYLDSAGPAHVLTARTTYTRPSDGVRRAVGRRLTCRYVWEPDPRCTWRIGLLDPDAPVRIAQRAP